MTYNEALSTIKEQVLAEPVGISSQWGDAALVRYMIKAACELNNALQFFKVRYYSPTIIGANGQIQMSSLPQPILSMTPGSLTVAGSVVRFTSTQEVEEQRHWLSAGLPRTYCYRPGNSIPIKVAPVPSSASLEGTLEYIGAYGSGNGYVGNTVWLIKTAVGASDQIWEGQYPHQQYLAAWLGGVYAWEQAEEYDRAQYWLQKVNQQMQSFAAELGRTNVANLTIPAELRDDKGAMNRDAI